jgi:hypothetical protein
MRRLHLITGGAAACVLLVVPGLPAVPTEPCSNDAGTGNLAEGEACLADNDVDTVNGGCNLSPALFVTLSLSDFIDGVADVCGSASTYKADAACDVDADCLDGNCVGDPNPGDGVDEGTCVGPGEPSAGRRDTDWYLVPQSVLAAHDTDGNGAVGIQSSFVGTELETITFHVPITDPAGECDVDVLGDIGCSAPGVGNACDVDSDCPGLDCVGDPVPGDGNPQGTCSTSDEHARNAVIIADHPDGLVVFAAPGVCNGGGIWDGYECSTGNNDYILRIEFWEPPTSCAPGPPQGPCGEASGGPGQAGCEDPYCCDLVCQEPGYEFCCTFFWSEGCAFMAIDLGCAVECCDGHVYMGTGDDPAVDGYLKVKADPYGAWADPSFGGTPEGSDRFNPATAGDDLEIVSFSNGLFIFMRETNQRELLAHNLPWQAIFEPDDSLDREITQSNFETDNNGDGITDQHNSQFEVTGADVDLTFDLQQNVEQRTDSVATLIQVYTITNNLATPIDFVLLRHVDADLVWQASTSLDDVVGTEANGYPDRDRCVFVGELGFSSTAVTVSSPQATAYVGAKRGITPDPSDPECPAYGDVPDLQVWEAYGLPDCWRNHIANVGYHLDGVSGAEPGDDAHVALEIPVALPAGPGTSTTVEVMFTYGQPVPWGQEGGEPDPCPWDCEPVGDGEVGITDFLALLAQWGQPETSCDFDGGGVGVSDFLFMLANWGPCL